MAIAPLNLLCSVCVREERDGGGEGKEIPIRLIKSRVVPSFVHLEIHTLTEESIVMRVCVCVCACVRV